MSFQLNAALRLTDVNFSRNIRRATQNMQGMRAGVSGLTKSLGLAMSAGTAFGAAFMSAKKAMDFQSQMSSIKALTGATNSQMAEMKKVALDAGASTKYSALEAAQGIEELLKAGITPATVKAGGLTAALNLATAGGLDLAEAAEIMSTSLNSFSKDGMKASDAANILAGTANASATDVHDLKYSLSAVAAVASGAGLSLKDTSSALGVLANKGLKGSDAGTSLKSMLLQLQPTTKKTAKLFEVLGLETEKNGNAFYDSKDKLKSMADIAQVLHDKFKNLTDGQRQVAFKEAFGTDAIRAANILYEAGAKGIQKFQKAAANVTAFDVAKEKMNNAAGAVEVFKGALETFQIQVMTPLLPVIKQAGLQFASWMSSIKPEKIQSWGNSIKEAGQKVLEFAGFVKNNWGPIKETVIALGAAFLAYKGILGGLMIIQTITQLALGLRAAYGLLTGAQWALNVAMDANPIGAVILLISGLVAAGVWMYRNWDTVASKMSAIWGWIQRDAAKSVNFMIGAINKLIGLINKIPGVNIPIIPKVHWGAAKAPDGMADFRKIESGKKAYHGESYVPRDNAPYLLHRGERVLTRQENKAYSEGKSGSVVQFGDIHIHGVGGDLDKAADKLMDIMARKIQTAGGAGA
ncbi:phage tail tape measure protein [Neobacillus cucumis]|nr:phage tail tape measure protein [Neobacillus cucumis]